MLTGHTKKIFEEWYNKKYDDFIFSLVGEHTFNPAVEFFDTMPLSHQQGVYLEFLREQGYSIEVNRICGGDSSYCFWGEIYDMKKDVMIAETESSDFSKDLSYYNTALTQAIEKCNEIINGDHNA